MSEIETRCNLGEMDDLQTDIAVLALQSARQVDASNIHVRSSLQDESTNKIKQGKKRKLFFIVLQDFCLYSTLHEASVCQFF